MVVNYVMQVNKNLTGTENQSELYFPNQHRLYKLSINRLKKKKKEFRKLFIPPGTRLKTKTPGSAKGAIV